MLTDKDVIKKGPFDIGFDGIEGQYEVVSNMGWNKIYYLIMSTNGIGYSPRKLVGSISRGNFDPPAPNKGVKKQIMDCILVHANKLIMDAELDRRDEEND